jgi:hypothetical protein
MPATCRAPRLAVPRPVLAGAGRRGVLGSRIKHYRSHSLTKSIIHPVGQSRTNAVQCWKTTVRALGLLALGLNAALFRPPSPLDRDRAGSIPIHNLLTVGFMSSSIQVPRIGMLATVRSRRGVVTSVEPFEEPRSSERLHLVTVEYSDYDGAPEEVLLWERECRPELLEPNALPRVDVEPPMPPEELLALQRATRWSAITPFLAAKPDHGI